MNIEKFPRLTYRAGKRVPLILQTEIAECGLACICMIASYWGHEIDLASIRRRFSVSLKGMNLKNLMTMAEGLSLQTRAVKMESSCLYAIKMPCILHWDFNHFVVLKSIAKNKIKINDPAVGERCINFSEFEQHFTGVALEMFPNGNFEKKEEPKKFTFLSLLGRVTGLKTSVIQLLILGATLQIFSLLTPFYMQWMIDEALISGDRDLVKVLGIGFLLLVFVQTIISAVRSWITTVFATNLNFQWFSNAFDHLLKLPLHFFDKRHTGDIISRFESIKIIQQSITIQFVEGIIDGALVLGTLIMMFLYSTSLACMSIMAVVIYLALRFSVFGRLKEATAEQIIHAAKQNTYLIESIRGIQSVRLFGRADQRRRGWMNSLVDQFNAEIRISKISITYQAANDFIFNCERVLIVWLAGLAVLDSKFSIGMLFAFVSYKDQFSQRMTSLVDKLFELKMLKLHGQRVADIVLTEAEKDKKEIQMESEKIQASIEIFNLSFRYADSEPYIIKNLNIFIPSGQSIAFTGASGCGKTTLLKLLLGLIEPTSGHILVGGVEINQLGRGNYRKMLGVVMQDDTLFSGSIAENICFFDPLPDYERIISCAELAAVNDEISAMPMGYSTLLGDIGTGLSGGQKQRILLARALYKDPKILVLDEATSHLDISNENSVNNSIKKFELTRIIVAHRPETIASAQRVVLLENGVISSDICQINSM